ncbi:putative RNA-directed DNA polymerase, eukaryota, reverse transcriptase zinc-binding domain protein [Tanacetum coccineum]
MNEVRIVQERRGFTFSRNEADVFNTFISNTGLIDLPMGGHMFTWTNKAGSKLSKLDRFLIFEEVISLLPDIKITSLDLLWSDHTPILLHCSKCDFGPILFKFYHSWFNREGIHDVIISEFNNLASPSDGSKLLFHEKLKALKPKIKHWVATTKSNEVSRKQVLLKDLSVLDDKIDAGLASSDDHETRIKLLQEADTLTNFDAMDTIQKARVKWDVEGDENTKFFHCLINRKRRTQSINGIMQEGVWITNPIQIKEAFLNFFKDKFKANDLSITFHPTCISATLQPSDRVFLKSNTTMDEVKNVVWECGSDKAPGPNGFTFSFVKRYWDILRLDILEFVSTFLSTKTMPIGSDSSFITLVPKVSNSVNIKDFRPISLIGIHYKIIAKLLANRLSKVVGKVVSHEQSAFIKDRQILDGPLILSEVIDWTSILINGSPTSEFNVRRGLRQGDPLSPFLFIIIMEGLHGILSDSVQSGLIRVFQVFYLASGLKLNIHKSNIFGIDVSNDDVHLMASNTGCAAAKLSGWKANLLYFGDRLTLIKFVLGSLGIYYFSIFKVPVSVLKSLEKMCATFFWGGSQDNRKLAWLKWPNVVASFEKGGLNIRSLKSFNLALLHKWHWRMLFSLEQEKDCLIIDRINNGQWTWNWSNNLSVRNSAHLNELLVEISHLDVQADIDKCIWSLDNDGVFSVGALRRLIDDHLLPSLGFPTTWDKDLPRKVNIFMWRLKLDKLPHRLNLSLRGIEIPEISCPSCNALVESNQHVFFKCEIAKDI